MAMLTPEEDIVAKIAPTPRKRAPPFKRTVSRREQSSSEPKKPDDDNDLDLFRHSKEVFPEILREAEEAEEDDQQLDRKRKKLSSSSSTESPYARKRSTTLDASDDDDDLIMDVKGKGKEIISARRRPSTPVKPAAARATPKTPGTRRTPSTRSMSKNPAGSPEALVTISDSDSDDVQPTAPTPSSQSKPNPSTPSRQNPPTSSSSPVEILASPSPLQPPTSPNPTDDFSEWVAKARALQTAQTHQAVVQVFVTSRMAGCGAPLLVRRRLNQGVQLLLDVWTNSKRGEMNIPDAVAAGLFLTWKGHKIYGHSSLAALGVQVDARGELRNSVGEGYCRGGIELEVWTEEEYGRFLASRGKERALMFGGEEEEEDGDGGVGGVEDLEPVRERKRGIRIALKARDHEPLRMTTREETTVETLIEAFRTQREIGPEWEVSIWFDGERLDEDSSIADLDVDPDEANQLEVHVKKAA
jgi:hypothetical protein